MNRSDDLDLVDYPALERMFSPAWWFSRVGTVEQRAGREWVEQDDGPRGLVCGVPCDEATGEIEQGARR